MTSVAGYAPLRLATSERPKVSIIICAYGQLERTYHSLYALSFTTIAVPYEVIVVDDASPDDTAIVVGAAAGVRLVVNAHNLGYLGSANRGMRSARGEYILLLNNDTAVKPGAVDALFQRLENDPSIGAAGGMLLNIDGTVQEAGGIIWRDGTGFNYGRGFDPEDPRLRHSRDVDYCSAAALMVRGSLLHSLGGFDERYAPAYYEDTDLCFRIREAGSRVVYEPLAQIMHAEGATYGKDITEVGKAGQEVNRHTFVQRWRTELARQFEVGATEVARDAASAPRVLMVELRLPDVTRDSGSVRLMAVIKLLRERGWTVGFWNTDGMATEPATTMLAGLGVEIVGASEPPMARIAALADDIDVIWIGRPSVAASVMPMLSDLAPQAALVYDTVDLHFRREERQQQGAGGDPVGSAPAASRPARVRKTFELSAVVAADLTIAISDDEAEVLRANVPDAAVLTLGNIHELPRDVPGPEQRSGVVFVGGWEHEPNIDAAHYLVEQMMPRLRPAVPGIRLSLVGSHLTDEIRGLAARDVDVLGWLPDVAPILRQRRVFCSPLWWGAGVKGKIGQALAHGIPVVTTTIGAEGMGLVAGTHALIADDLEGLLEATIALMEDDDLWQRLSRAGRQHIAATLSETAAKPRIRTIADAALALSSH